MYVNVTCSSKRWLLWNAEIAVLVSKASVPEAALRMEHPPPETEPTQLKLKWLWMMTHSLVETTVPPLLDIKTFVFAVLQTLSTALTTNYADLWVLIA